MEKDIRELEESLLIIESNRDLILENYKKDQYYEYVHALESLIDFLSRALRRVKV